MAGSLIGQITNGQYTKTAASQETTKSNTTTSTSKTADKKGTQYNEEMFLQLLVAEMQYQDPLEPTDNSQYVAQLASFSQIEAIQSVQSDMKTIQANSLVGNAVALNVDNEEIHGVVDFIRKDDDGELYASINGKEYPVSKIITVLDNNYYSDALMADAVAAEMKKLPSATEITLNDADKLTKVASLLSAMSERGKSLIDKDILAAYNKTLEKYAGLVKAKEDADKKNEEASKDEESQGTSSVEGV